MRSSKRGLRKEKASIRTTSFLFPSCRAREEIRDRNRDDEDAAGVPDVDISITTRELARMIKMAQLNLARLPEEDF